MDKYGVQTGGDMEKTATAKGDTCPVCKSKIERHGNVIKCPKCGTAPFEKERKDGDS